MRLSDLQNKDIVNVLDGKKIGSIIDINIDSSGNMKGLVVEENHSFPSFLKNKGEIEIAWEKIEKIGEDVILVNIS